MPVTLPRTNLFARTVLFRQAGRQPLRPFSVSRAYRQDPKDIKISSNYSKPPVPKSRNSDQLPVLPLVFIFCLGSFLFYRLSKSREGQGKGRLTPSLPKLEEAPTQFDRKNIRES